MTTNRLRGPAALAAAGMVAVLSLAACGHPNTTQSSKQTDSGGQITVWVDAPRIPGVNAFKEAHPGFPIKVVTIATADSSSKLQQQFTLFDKAKKGWPDAIFFPDNGDIAWATSAQMNYAADLTKQVPDNIKSGYDKATIAPCMINGKLRCLRNDTAPDVLWYNKTLFDKWGYKAPKTWPDYEATALKIANHHPGYVSGLLGDGYTTGRYLWASECPITSTTGNMKALINTSDPRCTRVKDMLSKMLAGKALTPSGIFDSAAAQLGTKLAMTPGAVWYGDYLFRDTLKIPAGQMTASNALYWPGDTQKVTGDEGGGLYGVSSHITGKELQNATTFVQWMVSAPAWQVKLSTGLPAWGPLRKAWLDKQGKAGYFADFPAMEKAVLAAPPLVSTQYKYLLYDPTQVWTDSLTPVITRNGSFDAGWNAFSSELANKAKTFGYQVVTH